MNCPECGSAAVETTLHVVVSREGRTLTISAPTEVETACSECGASVIDEQAEALARETLPALFDYDLAE